LKKHLCRLFSQQSRDSDGAVYHLNNLNFGYSDLFRNSEFGIFYISESSVVKNPWLALPIPWQGSLIFTFYLGSSCCLRFGNQLFPCPVRCPPAGETYLIGVIAALGSNCNFFLDPLTSIRRGRINPRRSVFHLAAATRGGIFSEISNLQL